MNTVDRSVADHWFPVARSEEVIARHVVHTQIFGQELAVWRDDAGAVNGWENRCPHRGVRLSIARNDGATLQCQYHGWRFASQSGRCVSIPAHPTQKPAATIHATTYPVLERDGFVWVSLGAPPSLPIALGADAITLRSVVIEANHRDVERALLGGYQFSMVPSPAGASLQHANVVMVDRFVLRTSAVGELATTVIFLLQPHTDSQTVVHGAIFDATQGPTAASATISEEAAVRMVTRRHHNACLTGLRDRLERTP